MLKKLKLLLTGCLAMILLSCSESPKQDNTYYTLTGKAMGTTYTIKYKGQLNDAGNKVDSLLVDFNRSLSTYDSTSTISRINQSEKNYCYALKDDPYFEFSLTKAIELSKKSGGAFDPTVMPAVNYFGFGYEKKAKPEKVSAATIDSLKALIGVDKIQINRNTTGDSVCIVKNNAAVKVDLNASAPGHGVDVIAAFFETNNIHDYMIEIGGEVRTAGLNAKGEAWTIGISKPVSGAQVNDVVMPIAISNKSLATSGNYRNFYEKGSIRLAHIIDPRTCSARPSDILSATIIADQCLDADAMATTCMVLGLKEATKFVAADTTLAAFFIYKDAQADTLSFYFSPGFSKHLISK
ncbi:MAG: FAD:protein FMN transferase [Saprospiraceae bacterium]|nr:FAD:protein FMN transferase [Saprospiraceae bacterium]